MRAAVSASRAAAAPASQEVNRLLNQYEASRKMMKQLTNMGKGKGGKFKKGKKRFPFGF